MAFHLPGSKSTPTTLAEINVTPFVDVMLVLLIIFMVSAPLMKQGAPIDLPKANTGTLDQAPDQIFFPYPETAKSRSRASSCRRASSAPA